MSLLFFLWSLTKAKQGKKNLFKPELQRSPLISQRGGKVEQFPSSQGRGIGCGTPAWAAMVLYYVVPTAKNGAKHSQGRSFSL